MITTVLPAPAQLQVLDRRPTRRNTMDDSRRSSFGSRRTPSPQAARRAEPSSRRRRGALAASLAPLMSTSARAQATPKKHPLRASGADRARLAHLGRAVQEDGRGEERRQDPGADLPQRADGQRARHGAGGAPGLDRDGRDRRRPDELGARDVDHRRAVPVEDRAHRLERDQRRVRRRPAQALARQGLRAVGLDRPRLSLHDQQQAADQLRPRTCRTSRCACPTPRPTSR